MAQNIEKSKNIVKEMLVRPYELDDAIIYGGTVPFELVSRYIGPKDTKPHAELLIAPEDLEKIDGGLALDVFSGAVKRTGRIRNYLGMDGVHISDRPDLAPNISYERALAAQLKMAVVKAFASDQPAVTGWFIPNLELMDSQHSNPEDVAGTASIASRTGLIARKGDQLVTTPESNHKWTCSEVFGNAGLVHAHRISTRETTQTPKNKLLAATRPVALQISL